MQRSVGWRRVYRSCGIALFSALPTWKESDSRAVQEECRKFSKLPSRQVHEGQLDKNTDSNWHNVIKTVALPALGKTCPLMKSARPRAFDRFNGVSLLADITTELLTDPDKGAVDVAGSRTHASCSRQCNKRDNQ